MSRLHEPEQQEAIAFLQEIWQRLEHFPTLGEVAEIHRGVECPLPNDEHRYVSPIPRRGFQPGLWKVTASFAGFLPESRASYLSTKLDDRNGGAFAFDWQSPKVIANAATLSRGMWRVAGFADHEGLIVSQNFHGIWPRDIRWLEAIEAVVNGPLANAFVAAHDGKRHVRKQTLARLPFPRLSPSDADGLGALVRELRVHLTNGDDDPLNRAEWERQARNLLLRIDAEVLNHYDLPPRIEKALLNRFQGEQRRVPFPFTGFYEEGFSPQLPLWMLTSADFTRCCGSFFQENVPKITDPSLVAALEEIE